MEGYDMKIEGYDMKIEGYDMKIEVDRFLVVHIFSRNSSTFLTEKWCLPRIIFTGRPSFISSKK